LRKSVFHESVFRKPANGTVKGKQKVEAMKIGKTVLKSTAFLSLITLVGCGTASATFKTEGQAANAGVIKTSAAVKQTEAVTTAAPGTASASAEKTTAATTAAGVTSAAASAASEPGKKSVVYMTKEITPESLIKVYEAMNWVPTGKVAVKLSTGEPPASNYLRPELIRDLVQKVNGTIVECNTAYGGQRASTELHKQVAKDHGFTAIADVDIMDEEGSMSIPVTGGTQLKEDFVGSHFKNYDSFLVLSHFKGHMMAGFGGAIKNISIGIGSSEGKGWIHTGGKNKTFSFDSNQDDFLRSMAEAGKGVSDYLGNGKRIAYVNVMNRLSIDCDCDGNPAEPEIADIGILSSSDPVALDQACIDLAFAAEGSKSLQERVNSRNGLLTLEHAQEIGLGTKSYELVNIDAQ
jgi:uncharacterized Fe-S center protein